MTNTAQKIAEYNGTQFPFPAGTTAPVMLNTLKAMYPELETGGYREESDKTVFFVVAQNKSLAQKIAEYNGTQFPFPEGTSAPVMLSTLKAMYPELETGGYREESDKTVFFVVAQNKSMAAGDQKIAEYNGTQFPFPAGTSAPVMLNTLKAMYPELEAGGYREEANKTVFFVVAQNKSLAGGASIIAEYNGTQFPFPAGTTAPVMLNTLKAMYPELEAGGYREEANKTVFFVVAQNKSK
jgi:DNA-binding transcriptional regulator YhcF (GntR family)